jgi:fumarate hydratase subunit alpha
VTSVLDVSEITQAVRRLAESVAVRLGERERSALEGALANEPYEPARGVLGVLLENARAAEEDRVPLCQDTGLAVVFVELGDEVRLAGGSLSEAVDEGVRLGCAAAGLRASVVADPLERTNTGDNTPAVLHVELVKGDRVRLVLDAKGGGSENCSRLAMLAPAAGREGVVRFAVETVELAGGKACPPLVVGVGIGGNFEAAPMLAKKALLRPLGEPSPIPHLAELEREILSRVNATGIGPAGLGGLTTALAVHVEAAPCHIASLPVAVNLDCHAHRHGEALL